MKQSPVLIIGIVGLIITAAMHLGMILLGVISLRTSLGLWVICYSAWIGFSILGFALSRKG